MTEGLRVAVVGAGYFGRFHLDAWDRNPEATLVAVCDPDPTRLAAATEGRAAVGYEDFAALLAAEDPDVIDIVAPPVTHADLIRAALRSGRTVICQKPFCTSLVEARAVTSDAAAAGTRVIIHENFRFQPWHRQLKRELDDGVLGTIYGARFALRPGDGRGPDAYLSRQPSFQAMPRFLIRETGVHFVDLYRWLFGPVIAVYADLRQLNPAIKGEDAGLMIFDHDSGATSIFDGNRHADHIAEDKRRTMGDMLVEGEGGALRLDGFGRLWLRRFGDNDEHAVPLAWSVDEATYGGGCVGYLIDHVVNGLVRGAPIENTAESYLEVVAIEEAVYRSAELGKKLRLDQDLPPPTAS
ncbi:Gfo/Idh/MocA family protein [Bauldia sp.]|uniref:Gfo/Idh/MocA family protein n=1 Tax=Bauldia sp. TaxID=2575872 RepID=UPI003BAB4629